MYTETLSDRLLVEMIFEEVIHERTNIGAAGFF